MSVTKEVLLWSGRPSQILAVQDYGVRFLYLGAAGAFASHFGTSHPLLWLVLLLPAGMLFWTWLQVRALRYELTSERARRWAGVFNRGMTEIELYRARETSLYAPFVDRLCGVSNLSMNYSDAYGSGTLIFAAISDAGGVREQLRGAIEAVRQRKGIRTVEAGL